MEVPTNTSLADIYPQDALESQTKRWNKLLSTFKDTYGSSPDFVSRSPGRVNIIGEHIDYSLYEVIPMAVTADVLLAVSIHPKSDPSEPSTLRLININPSKFASKEFTLPASGDVEIDPSTLEWTNYFKSGLSGATGLLRRKQANFKCSVGMSILADGTVPSGGGLSSSAAFVCASALAVMRANGEKSVDKKELVELAIVSERSVGVNSGGMDQAASVFPLRDQALYVSFVPSLSATNISLPQLSQPLTVLIAQSFVAADKHTTAPVCYNLRVVECTLAALVLGAISSISVPSDAGPLGKSLRGYHDAYFSQKESASDNNHTASKETLQKQLESLIEKVDHYLPQEEGYTREQISEILGIPVPEIEKTYFTKFPIRATHFKLRQRALHVFGEALRVLKFMDLLNSPPPSTPAAEQELLISLGGLLNDTQDSCREIYECSCPELEELCSLARSAGAYGSRLTGAGWGGCSVHLVPADKVDSVKEKWVREYYKKHFPDITPERLEEAIVVSKPGSGSAVLEVMGRGSV